MNRIANALLTIGLIVAADPALAGRPLTPAPIAGIGIGAVALIGFGYRALKSRIRP